MITRNLTGPTKFLLLSALICHSFLLFAYPGQVLQSFTLPGQYGTGIAFDGKSIWFADRKTDLLYCINPSDGAVIRTLQSPGYWPLALTWDGTALWNSDLKGGTDISEDYNGVI